MTDWSRLEHAYGSAEDVPALLDRLVPDPAAEVWDELWSRICHQLTVYTASFAALPRLTDIARAWAPADRTQILALCGAIVAGAQQRDGAAGVRARYAAEIAELLRLADESLRAPAAALYLFGGATCPDCGAGFSVADQVVGQSCGTAATFSRPPLTFPSDE